MAVSRRELSNGDLTVDEHSVKNLRPKAECSNSGDYFATVGLEKAYCCEHFTLAVNQRELSNSSGERIRDHHPLH